jgi:putative transposase
MPGDSARLSTSERLGTPPVNGRNVDGKTGEPACTEVAGGDNIGDAMSAHAFHQLYYHFVWTTKNRAPILEGDACAWMIQQLDREAHRRGGIVLARNVMPDHVHLLVSLPPTICVSTYVGQVKGATTFEFNQQHPSSARLDWQQGNGVVSMRAAEVDRVAAYVDNQQVIHAGRKLSRLLEQTEADG